MPARKESSSNVYQVRIALLDTRPAIWRRLLVPPHFTLRRFHQAIQLAMGWTNSHLHEFRVGKQTYGEPDADNDPFGITRRKDERQVLLREMLPRIGSKAFYVYDFGDSWEHADNPLYPQKFSALGIRIGVNYITYAMTH